MNISDSSTLVLQCETMSDNEALSDFEDDEEDENVTLIRLVRENEFLYTKADKRYTDRNLAEKTWSQIATEMGSTKDETKERWTRLRNNFSKVLARRKAKSASVSAMYGPFKPWIYEEEMEFVKKHVSNSRGRNSCLPVAHDPTPNTASVILEPEVKVEASPSWDITQSEEQPSMTGNCDRITIQARKRPAKSMDEVDQTVLPYIQTANNQCANNQPEEPLVMWFKSLLPMLKSLPPEQVFNLQITTMQEIQRLTQINHQSSS